MFSIGDRVVHPMHGAGIIDGIVEEKVGGDRRSYYVFRLIVGGLVLKIPVAGSSSIRCCLWVPKETRFNLSNT